jgi:hypothetical protein
VRIALLLATLVLAGCSSQAPSPRPVAETRPAGLTSCPHAVARFIPADLPFVDRQTLNLGDGLLGDRRVFQRTTARRVVLMVGPDPEDTFEDLDMHQRDVVLGGKRVSLSTTHLQPDLALLAVPAVLPEACGGLYVVAERLTPTELDALVKGLTVQAAEPSDSPG